MTKQTVNLGTSENSNNGDPLRTAFQKINENFDELYDSNTLGNAPDNFGSTLIPRTDGVYDLGSSTNKWDEIHANQVFARDWIDINGRKLTVDASGNLNFPGIINATVRTKQDIQGDIFADDSTRVFDSATGRFTGDLTGSVFADDSTLLVDGVNGTIPWSVLSDKNILTSSSFSTATANARGTFQFTLGFDDGSSFTFGPLEYAVPFDNYPFGSYPVGSITGDLTGSVFADDSTLLVDGVNGTIPGYVKIADLKTALQDGAGDYTAFKAWVLANL